MADEDVSAAPIPSAVQIDRRKLAALQARSSELSATQTVLAVVCERLQQLTGLEVTEVSNAEFETPPSLRAERKDGVVTVTTFR